MTTNGPSSLCSTESTANRSRAAALFDGLNDPFDAPAAIDAQARLMRDLLRRFSAVPLALAAYNAGPAPVAACGCVPAIPETRGYVARILGLMSGAAATRASPTAPRRPRIAAPDVSYGWIGAFARGSSSEWGRGGSRQAGLPVPDPASGKSPSFADPAASGRTSSRGS
jgi:Transglycosylase SLT domain